MSEFVHLHLHTQFSLLDGAIRFEPLFAMARSFNMPACAITDHGNMFGVVDFYFAARAAGIKPIIGCEAYIAPNARTDKERHEDNAYHVVLLAENNAGYANLMKLISIAHMEGFYYVPRIDKEILRRYNEGLICMTACLKGQVPQAILRSDENGVNAQMDDYLSIFGPDRLFLELQDNGIPEQKKVNEGLIRLADRYSLPLIATNDCHYLKRQEARAHELLLCIQTGKKMSDTDRLKLSTDEFYFKSPDEMTSAFAGYPQALRNYACHRGEVQCHHRDRQVPLPQLQSAGGHEPGRALREALSGGLRKEDRLDSRALTAVSSRGCARSTGSGWRTRSTS